MENENFNTDQQPDEIIKPQQEEQSSPKQEQYVWHQDDYAANLNKQPAEGASFREEEPVQPYFPGTDSKTYKQNIKSMKQEYKAIKREEKKQKENPGTGNRSIFSTAAISAICTLIIVSVAFIFISVFPTPGNSILGRYVRSLTSATGSDVSGTELEGGQFYMPNKETITIEDNTTDVCTAVYAKVSPSIVGIRIVQVSGSMWQQSEQILGEGTGTVYSSDGKIITNYHVIETVYEAMQNINALNSGKYEIRVYFDTTLQEYYTATILGGDSRTDLALLQISLTGLIPVEFADSDEILVGSDAIVMGGGGGIEFLDSVNKGIISGLHRNITTESEVLYDLIQTDAAINPGNSGGALLNSEGKLIGICFLKISASEYDNMAFAIPSNTVKKIISQIEENGAADAPYIGVIIDTTYTKNIADNYSYPIGAWISSVSENGPADKANLTTGDIITEYNGKTITSYNDLRSAVNSSQVGDKVTLKVYRTSEKKEITVTVTVENSNG